jgi:hypothetical protein
MKKNCFWALLLFGWGALFCAAQGTIPVVKPQVFRSGVGLKGAAFGVPDVILDQFLYEYPAIRGHAVAFEMRSFGAKGRRSTVSGLYSFEYSRLGGTGLWREEEGHWPRSGKGEVTQLSLCASILLNIFPRSPVHPYIGAGLGVEKVSYWAEGAYTDDLGNEIKETYEGNRIFPVVHLPLGIAAYIGERIEIRLEGGIKNGFYLGGTLSYLF